MDCEAGLYKSFSMAQIWADLQLFSGGENRTQKTYRVNNYIVSFQSNGEKGVHNIHISQWPLYVVLKSRKWK